MFPEIRTLARSFLTDSNSQATLFFNKASVPVSICTAQFSGVHFWPTSTLVSGNNPKIAKPSPGICKSSNSLRERGESGLIEHNPGRLPWATTN